MIQNNKGFTLIELMAVIAILALIITIASASVMALINDARNRSSEEMRNNLKEAAIIYVIEEFKLPKCSKDFSTEVFENKEFKNKEANKSCLKELTVEYLKNEGLFEDEKGYCSDLDTVIVYRYSDGQNSEYKAYINDEVCKNY